MIELKLCSDFTDTQIFETFEAGFIDYMIKAKMDETMFISRFFGPEGNDRELSYIALKDGKPVGITLGGIKTDEPVKTMRCGGMSVIPEERRKGIAKMLMDKHIQTGKEMGCRQMFLEVINGNDKAFNFYKKLGYEKIYDLTYRTWHVKENPLSVSKDVTTPPVEDVAFEDIHALRALDHSHLPWQGCFDYAKHLPCYYYGIKENDSLVAGMIATANRIVYLWVHPEKRGRGYATALLQRAISDLDPEVLRINYANNALAHTFCNHLGMALEPISQYEMYRLL